MDTGRVRSWTVRLNPGDALDFRPADWADTLVVVDRGDLELECCSGRRARFAAGSVLTLDGLPVRRLRNASADPLVLSATTRRPRHR